MGASDTSSPIGIVVFWVGASGISNKRHLSEPIAWHGTAAKQTIQVLFFFSHSLIHAAEGGRRDFFILKVLNKSTT